MPRRSGSYRTENVLTCSGLQIEASNFGIARRVLSFPDFVRATQIETRKFPVIVLREFDVKRLERPAFFRSVEPHSLQIPENSL